MSVPVIREPLGGVERLTDFRSANGCRTPWQSWDPADQVRIARRAMTDPTAMPVASPATPTAGAVILTTRRAVR